MTPYVWVICHQLLYFAFFAQKYFAQKYFAQKIKVQEEFVMVVVQVILYAH